MGDSSFGVGSICILNSIIIHLQKNARSKYYTISYAEILAMNLREVDNMNVKFECNCTNETEFAEMLNEVHNAKWGYNFEIGARLWYIPEGFDKAIMVEYQITTQECKELVENEDEPDWLTAYEVDDMNDYDCSDEIFTETIESNRKQ